MVAMIGLIVPTIFGSTSFQTTLTFDKSTHQWFRNAQNGDSSCEFGSGSGTGSQSSNPKDHGEGWLYYATTTNSGSGCYVPAWDFDVSGIPDDATIVDVDFIVDVSQHQSNDGNFTCDFREVNADISRSFDSTLWHKITTDQYAETYVSNDTVCTGTKIGHIYDLGENANDNLRNDLVGDEKFTISAIKTDNIRSISSSGEGSYNIRLENAQLSITYTITEFEGNDDEESIFSILLRVVQTILRLIENTF